MPTMQGVVTGKSKWGILLDHGPWLNWTKPEYQKEPWDAAEVKKGDVVTLEVADDNEGNPKWISSIKITGPSQDVTPEDRFPGEEAWQRAHETRPEAPGMGPMEQGDTLYIRVAALNAAVALAPSMSKWAEESEVSQTAHIHHLADEFENRLGR